MMTFGKQNLYLPLFQVYLGGHEQYGEDGIMIVADRAIGRDDYGQPQCSFRKRINSNFDGGCDAPSFGSLFGSSGGFRQPRGPIISERPVNSWFTRLFNRRQNRRQSRQMHRQFFRKRIGIAIRQGKDVTFTNDIALIKLRHRVQFSDRIRPVRLPTNDYNYMGYQCYVAGWGIQGPDEGPSPTLKGAELAVSF